MSHSSTTSNKLIHTPVVADLHLLKFDPPTATFSKIGRFEYNSIQNITSFANRYHSNQFTVLLLKILRYKSAYQDETKKSSSQGKNNHATNKSPNRMYDKAITVMCPHSAPGLNVGMILINSSNCDKIFGSQITHRDNRDGFSPGSYVVVKSPSFVKDMFGNEEQGVPILHFSGPMYLVDQAKSHMKIPQIVHLDSADKMSGMFYHNVEIRPMEMDFDKSGCNGYLCDSLELKPGAVELGCPCYTIARELSRVLLVIDLLVVVDAGTDNEIIFEVDDFFSRSFTYLVTKNGVPAGYSPARLHKDEVADEIFFAIREFIKKVNGEGGWTVTGWYRHGLRSDQTNEDSGRSSAMKVKSSSFKFNMVKLEPTIKLTKELEAMRADIYDIIANKAANVAKVAAEKTDSESIEDKEPGSVVDEEEEEQNAEKQTV